MGNPKHLAKFRQGVEAWNRWREADAANINATDAERGHLCSADLSELRVTGADLRYANLSHANLIDVNFSKVDLSGANLSYARLLGANLSYADLRGANFSYAKLHGANLTRASLVRANLSHADLHEANLLWSNLRGADLTGSKLGFTNFGSANLVDIKGLDTCVHSGPCIIDYQSLAKSDSLPREFLQGCGLPDTLIDYLPSLFDGPIRYHSCFISYSTKNQDFADRLHTDLQNRGVRCWFAPRHVQGGKKLHDQIVEAIHFQDRLLLILSEDSMNSEWVHNEIFHARRRERTEKRQVLFPVRLVSYEAIQDWTSDAAPEIARYFIPDFSRWRNQHSYLTALEHLIRDLRTASGVRA